MAKDTHTLSAAFANRPDILKQVNGAVAKYPDTQALFIDIASYVRDLQQNSGSDPSNEPASKKRKIESNETTLPIGGKKQSWSDVATPGKTSFPLTSVTIPNKPKGAKPIVEVTEDVKGGGGIRARDDTQVFYGVGYREIEQVFCVPVPEKSSPQYSFLVIPRGGDGITPAPEDTTAPEPLLWTQNEPKGKAGGEPSSEWIERMNQSLRPHGKKVIEPTEDEFRSTKKASSLSTSPNNYHVKASRGPKDGFLFLLSTGILYVFKKPILYIPFSNVYSVSYTNILTHTFNMVITINNPVDTDYEFQMIDQVDYNGINAYVQRHGLNDASMAENRKAKKLNVNGPKIDENGNEQDGQDGDDDLGELAKAERQLQDEEDEEEEDFVPDEDDGGSATSDSEEDSEEDGEEGGEVEYDEDEEEEEEINEEDQL